MVTDTKTEAQWEAYVHLLKQVTSELYYSSGEVNLPVFSAVCIHSCMSEL